MMLGFTGTRKGMTDKQKQEFEDFLRQHKPTSFGHGDCEGADDEAANIVHEVLPTCYIIAYPGPKGDPHRAFNQAANETRPAKTHFARNRDIVEDSDMMFAAPAEMKPQRRGGTWYTIKCAQRTIKPLTVSLPE